jgi:type II secretory pathway pseudopilin PulG
MRRNELTIVISLVVIGLIAAFWLVALSPKREQASTLKQDIDQLHSRLDQAEQAASLGEEQRKSFPTDYRRLVVLGKAVPEDGDQAGFLVQLQRLADKAGVRFESLDLSGAASSESAPPATDSASATSTETTTSSESVPSDVPAETASVATEASAATLPIGATIGPAGLPVMPYHLKFTGGFFEISDFLAGLDGLVHARHSDIDVHGRLLTVDGFALQPSDTGGADPAAVSPVPTLTADLSITTYLAPADQGLTGEATPGGPAPATSAPETSASNVTPAATSSVSP